MSDALEKIERLARRVRSAGLKPAVDGKSGTCNYSRTLIKTVKSPCGF